MIAEIINFLVIYRNYFGELSEVLDYTMLTWVYVVFYALLTIIPFVLKGIGIYVLSEKNGLDKGYLGFVPFVSFYQFGRLVGEMTVFRVKVKNLGLWVGVLYFAVLVISNVAQYLRYYETLEKILNSNSFVPVATSEGVDYDHNIWYTALYYTSVALDLVHTVFFIFLTFAFFRFYAPKNALVFVILGLLFDPLFSIFVFVVRNNKKGSFYRSFYYAPTGMGQGGAPNGGNGFSTGGGSPFSEYDRTPHDNVFDEYPDRKTDENAFKATKNDNDPDDLF